MIDKITKQIKNNEKLLDLFKSFGKDTGCSGIEATARMGFWKWLQQDQFERSYVVYERSLEDE